MFYLVFVTQLLLISLTALLLARLVLLAKKNTFAVDGFGIRSVVRHSAKDISKLKNALSTSSTGEKSNNIEARINSLTQAQIFSSAQLMIVRQKGLLKADSQHKDEKNWLIKAVVCYLIGSSSQIAKHFECSDLDIDDVIMFVLTKNLKLSPESAEHYLRNEFITEAKETYIQALFAAGKNAAAQWVKEKKVEQSNRLYEAINEWGLIA